MIFGHQHLCHHRVMDTLTDLVTDKFGVVLVGFSGEHDVTEIGQPFGETWLLPQPFVLLQPFFWRDIHSRPRVKFVHERARRFVAGPEDLRIICFDLELGLVVDRSIPKRGAIIRRPLEYGQVGDFRGNHWNELDGGCSSADNTHSLACQVHPFFGPSTCVTPSSLEAVDTFEIGYVTCG